MRFWDQHKGEHEETKRTPSESSVFKDDDMVELKKANFKTSLTLVLSDDSQAAARKQKEKPSRTDYSLLLSGLYALILILIGFLFPLAEVLQDNWLQSEYITVFLVYIYGVATIFLIYAQAYLLHSSHHQKHPAATKTDQKKKVHPTSPGNDHTSSPIELPASPGTDPGNNNNNLSSVSDHNVEATSKDSPRARRKLAKHRSLTAMVRYSSSVNLNSKDTEREFDGSNGNLHALQTQAPRLTGFPQEEFGEVVDEEFERWIDMSKLGSIFSHEGSSFYLRVGSLFFGIGHLIYVCLEIENSYHTQPGCPTNTFWWTYIIRLIFIVVQTFFLFKNHTVHIEKQKVIARFGFAHLIATNFCVWLRTLSNEIMQEYSHLSEHHDASPAAANQSTITVAPTLPPAAGHLFATIHGIVKRAAVADGDCPNFRGILQYASVYLFPFVLEYSLIAMGTFAILYYHIDAEAKDDMVRGLANFFKVQAIDLSDVEKAEHGGGGPGGEGSHHGSSVFKKSHRGMFTGIILLAGIIVSITLFFFTMDSEQNTSKAELIYLTSDIILHSILLVAAAAATVRVHLLSYIAKPVSVDDMLLYLSMSGTLILEMSVTIASGSAVVSSGLDGNQRSIELLRLFGSLIAALQTIVQMVMILSGMRRYPSKASHVTDMPGRGLVTFLVVGNVAVWIFRTAQAKELTLQGTQSHFYGDLAWLLLMNVNLPLLLFYRFHSSICLADVWVIAYTPLHEKVPKTSDHKQRPDDPNSPTKPEFSADARMSSIIRSISVPQLYHPAPGRGNKESGGQHNAVFQMPGISPASSVPSLCSEHRL